MLVKISGAWILNTSLAATRGAIACRHEVPTRLGSIITGAVEFAEAVPVLRDAAASELGCALNAPLDATCDSIRKCNRPAIVGGRTVTVHSDALERSGVMPHRAVRVGLTENRSGGRCAGECEWWLPAMRKQILDAARRMRLNACEHVGQVRDGVHAVFLAGRDQRLENGEIMAGLLVTHDDGFCWH
jgi:hypothetical protein